MHRMIFLLLFTVAACVPAPRGTWRAPPRDPAKILRQCLVDLGAAGARFESLPDRQLGGGCATTGTVKLVAIGIPVTNLGAMTCGLATPFTLWTRESVQQAARAWLDSSVTKIESYGTFACRPVNGMAGNALSQHAFANAVDIAAFQLADGRRISVKDGWNDRDPAVRSFLRALHASACRRFAVVLGPEANALHRDHFHFDMGPGRYCR